MSFSSKWAKSKFEMSERIDKMDNIQAQDISVNIVNGNGKPDGQRLQYHHGSEILKLLSEVGAEITPDDSSHVLKFNPFLAGPQVDAERWIKALELENLFFKLNT